VLSPATIAHAGRRAEVEAALRRVGPRAWQTSFDLDEQKLAIYRRRYRARVREADAVVGRLVERVRERGLLESTIVVVSSDHGESFGEQRLLTHSFGEQGDYEATHRVPMLWVFPRRYRIRARVSDERITTADVAPTLYDFVGLDWRAIAGRAPDNYGRSLAPVLKVVVPTTAAAEVDAQRLSEEEQASLEEKAQERLRALGYIP
jgi:arylsulfatase A-like enzyme